jgi:hypothetical protein
MTITKLKPRHWQHTPTGLRIWLPEDKRSFRVVETETGGYEYVTPIKFRTFEGAVRFLNALEA